jgi:hypothetical protein
MLDINQEEEILYQHIGKLFYAIAYADGIVRIEEMVELEEILQKYWKTDSNEQYIRIIFKSFQDQLREEADAETCFNEFIMYKEKQPGKFTETLKTLILKTSHGIAASFANKNKSELIFLGKLSINLKS